MKRILLSIVLLAGLSGYGMAAFPTNESVHTNELDKLSDDFSDFRFRWTGYNSQSVTFTIATTAGVGYNMAGYTAAFTATKRTSAGTNVVYVSKGAADCTVSGSNVSFTVTYAEVPPNGTYNAELILMDSGNALYRTLGRGTVFVRESLYASSGTNFPFPSLTSTLGDLGDVTITSGAQGDILYRGASVWQNLAAGTAGYVLTSGGAGANPSWAASGGTAASFTNYIAGDTEAVVTGDARSGSNVLSIGSTIARDTEVTAATSGVYTAAVIGGSNAAATSAAATFLPLAGGTLTGDLIVTNAGFDLWDDFPTIKMHSTTSPNYISNIGTWNPDVDNWLWKITCGRINATDSDHGLYDAMSTEWGWRWTYTSPGPGYLTIPELRVTRTITEGGTLLSSLYAPISFTPAVASNTAASLVSAAMGMATNSFASKTVFSGSGTTGLVTSAAGDAGKYLKADGTWATPAGGSGVTPYGYISGLWPQYVDTNTVVITNGDGICYDTYFSVTNPAGISVDVTTWATTNWNGTEGWGYQYYYVAYSSLSANPNAPSIYAATNLPVYDTVHCGWYNSATQQDRVVGALCQSNTSSRLFAFTSTGNGVVQFCEADNALYRGRNIALNMNPDGTWQTPSIDSSVCLPVNAVAAVMFGIGGDADSVAKVAITSYEESLIATLLPENAGWCGRSQVGVGITPVVYLGATRNVRIAGANDDDNNLTATIYGYIIGR